MDIDKDFPTDEDEIIELARKMIEGLTKHADIFPSPPIPVAELQRSLDALLVSRYEEQVAIEKERQATEAMEAAYKDLCDAHRSFANDSRNDADQISDISQQVAAAGQRLHRRNDADQISNISPLRADELGLADRFFSKLPEQDTALVIPKPDTIN